MNEFLFLQSIFRNSMKIQQRQQETIYHFQIKQKEFSVTCTSEYPFELPTISSNHLNEQQVENVYEMASRLLGTPMIYDILLCCVKQDELDLNLSSSITVDYELGEVSRITEEEFNNWIEKNQKKIDKSELMTGKVLFVSGNHKENVEN